MRFAISAVPFYLYPPFSYFMPKKLNISVVKIAGLQAMPRFRDFNVTIKSCPFGRNS